MRIRYNTLWHYQREIKITPEQGVKYVSKLAIKGELHSNYIFFHFALIGLEWDSLTLFTKMNFFFYQNSHFNIICTRYIYDLLFTNHILMTSMGTETF